VETPVKSLKGQYGTERVLLSLTTPYRNIFYFRHRYKPGGVDGSLQVNGHKFVPELKEKFEGTNTYL
jgi:hypothetical protein